MAAHLQLMAFLQDIKAHPDDDAPRLIFADWLEDHGDPARAELFRVQVLLSRMTDDSPDRGALQCREQYLRAQHGEGWLGPLRGLLPRWEYHRGLLRIWIRGLEGVTALAGMCEADTWKWVERISFRGMAGNLDWLTTTAYLSQLSQLSLRGNQVDEAGMASLACSPYLTQLTQLELGDNQLGDAGASALANAPHLAGLTQLNLTRTLIGPEGATALAASPHLAQLNELTLTGNAIGDGGALALASSPYLTRLSHLRLLSCGIGPSGEEALRQRFGAQGILVLNEQPPSEQLLARVKRALIRGRYTTRQVLPS